METSQREGVLECVGAKRLMSKCIQLHAWDSNHSPDWLCAHWSVSTGDCCVCVHLSTCPLELGTVLVLVMFLWFSRTGLLMASNLHSHTHTHTHTHTTCIIMY